MLMWWLIPVSLVLVAITFAVGICKGARIAEEREGRMRQRWIAERAEFGPARAAGTIVIRPSVDPELPPITAEQLGRASRLSRP